MLSVASSLRYCKQALRAVLHTLNSWQSLSSSNGKDAGETRRSEDATPSVQRTYLQRFDPRLSVASSLRYYIQALWAVLQILSSWQSLSSSNGKDAEETRRSEDATPSGQLGY